MTINYKDDAGTPQTHLLEEEAGDAPGTTRPVHGLPDDVKANLLATKNSNDAIQAAVEALSGLIDTAKLKVVDSGAATLLGTINTTLGTINTTLGTINTSIGTVDGHVDGLEGFTDGIETLLSSLATSLSTLDGHVDGLEGFTDGIEALLTTISATLTTLDGNVDGLEGFTDGIETKLDTINTSLGTINTSLGTIDGRVDTVEAKLQSVIDALAVPSGGPKGGNNSDVDTSYEALSGTSVALTRGVYIQNTSTGGQVATLSMDSGTTDSIQLNPGQISPFIEVTNANVPYAKMSANNGSLAWIGA